MHPLDVRLPLGLLFLILGTILMAYGVIGDDATYARHAFGKQVNLGWGGVLMLFGGIVLSLAMRARRRRG